MKLTGDEFTVVHTALTDAFVDYDDLGLMLAMTGHNIADFSAPGPKPVVAMRIIQHAAARDQIDDLVAGARAAKPTNRLLVEAAAAIGLEPAGVTVTEGDRDNALPAVRQNLERIVNADDGIADFGSYAIKIQELLRRVCAVELGPHAGTGFLIGPDTVLTNHHVVRKAIDGEFDPADIVLRFDYRRLRDGRTASGGVSVSLADGADWLVDAEPHSGADLVSYDEQQLPADHELDYAVLRTREQAGTQPSSGPGALERGWIAPLSHAYDFPPDSLLMIVQHPCNDPISYHAPHDAVMRVNPNGTRVHYRTNTMPGSSGSPVLNPALELVALHHAGEPGSPDHWKPCHEQTTPALYNEGIPIARIEAHLATKGLAWVFGPEAQ